MGVIENAIEKLRRAGENPAAQVPLQPAARLMAEPLTRSSRIVDIDRAQLRAAGYLAELGHEQKFADYYQAVKRPVIRRALSAEAATDHRLIMVTSAVPGDGKTFTSLNLALSMAREKDLTVLLVDADFAMAQVDRVLGIKQEAGFLDAVADSKLDVESFVLRTNVPGLDLLPGGGSRAPDAAELVASSHVAQVINRLLTYDPRRLVLFDASPLLAAADARALVHLAGQVLLVARSGHTPQPALLEAIAQIDKNKLQGLVLNDAYNSGGKSYYGYSGYGHWAEAKREAAR